MIMYMQTEKKSSRWLKRLAYGSGDTSCNIVVGMVSAVLVLFYTDYVGIDPGVIGTIMLISKILDGFVSYMMGIFAEKTSTKYGKYRPWLLWGCIPYAISVILMFTVPDTGMILKIIYVFVTYNICTSVMYNVINIPYSGMAYVLTREAEERDMLSIVRMCLASMGRLIAVCGTLPLIKFLGNGRDAWIKITLFWAIVAVILLFFCFFKCKEVVVVKDLRSTKKISLAASMKTIIANKYFWMVAAIQALQSIYFIVNGTGMTYYCKYILGNDGWLYSSLYMLETILLIIVMLLSAPLIQKFGKRKVAFWGLSLSIAAQFLLMLNPESIPFVFANSILRSIGYAPLNAVTFAFIGEAVEYGHWKFGLRQEGLIAASSTVITKIGGGLGTAAITGLLSLAGYISTTNAADLQMQPDNVLQMIKIIYLAGMLLVFFIYMIVLWGYKLEKQMPEISEELMSRER